MRAARAAVALLLVAGCATERPKEGESAKASWVPNVTSIPLLTPKGTKATLVSELTPGAYQASNLAVGEEKDLARQRAQGLGFVRSAPVEQHLAALRAKLVATSGVTGVPGRVMILADPAFSAVSTADGNVYVAMGCLESLNNDDEVAAILAHELAHVLLKHHTSDIISDVQKKAQTLHEIGVYGRAALSSSKTASKSDTRALANEQLIADVTDKVALPAWSRRQEREARREITGRYDNNITGNHLAIFQLYSIMRKTFDLRMIGQYLALCHQRIIILGP
jgi:predicted Zn-dependent protease